jgi:hypothetical protein
MINRKQTTMYLAIVGMALLATVMTVSSPTPALALGHWNLDENFDPNSGFAEDGMDSSGTTDNTNEEDSDEDSSTTAATTDEDGEEGSEDSSDGSSKKEDSSHVAYDDLQACLSDAAGRGSPTAEEVQGCVESSYAQSDSNEDTSTESGGNDNQDENGVGLPESISTGNTEDEGNDEDEDDSPILT